MQEWVDWIAGIISFTFIIARAILTVINYRKRSELAAKYRAVCSKCGGKPSESGGSLPCDHCSGVNGGL